MSFQRFAFAVAFAVCLLLGASGASLAQTVTNDNFASAVTITGQSGTSVGFNTGATREAGEPIHAGVSAGFSVWHNWTAPSTATVTFSTSNTSFKTVIAVYTGTAVTALTPVASAVHPSSATLTTSVSFIATAGTIYRVAVDGAVHEFGAFALNWNQAQRPQTGWYWNPAEPGRGFAIETRVTTDLVAPPRIQLAALVYDINGRSLWYHSAGTMTDVNQHTGALGQFRGGQTIFGGFRQSTALASAGNGVLNFPTPTLATMVWPGGTTLLQRFEFATNGVSLGRLAGYPENGWWWNPSQPGRGFFLEFQSTSMFFAMLAFDDPGEPIWAVTHGAMTTNASYSGRLFEFMGGQPVGGSPRLPTNAIDRGTISIAFSSTTAGTVTLSTGATVAIQRFSTF